MKTNKWCSILLMGLMLGACSKDVIEPDNGEHTDWETNKVGYINLNDYPHVVRLYVLDLKSVL